MYQDGSEGERLRSPSRARARVMTHAGTGAAITTSGLMLRSRPVRRGAVGPPPCELEDVRGLDRGRLIRGISPALFWLRVDPLING